MEWVTGETSNLVEMIEDLKISTLDANGAPLGTNIMHKKSANCLKAIWPGFAPAKSWSFLNTYEPRLRAGKIFFVMTKCESERGVRRVAPKQPKSAPK